MGTISLVSPAPSKEHWRGSELPVPASRGCWGCGQAAAGQGFCLQRSRVFSKGWYFCCRGGAGTGASCDPGDWRGRVLTLSSPHWQQGSSLAVVSGPLSGLWFSSHRGRAAPGVGSTRSRREHVFIVCFYGYFPPTSMSERLTFLFIEMVCKFSI